ncbi:MAG TPA: hypothetical protein VFV66_13830 [Nonomuraea sp.]|nr:hypothetical protein [Nonomuraea sp.]
MRRRAHLFATAALVATLSSLAVASPAGGPVDTLHGIRDAVIGAGARFYGLPDILSGALTDDLNLHKNELPLPL